MPESVKVPVIKIGCDPELFVMNNKTKKIVSAHNLLSGTKDHPYTVSPRGAVQVDGIAAEFNITPAEDQSNFAHSCRTVIDEIKKLLGPDYSLVTEPVAFFDQEYWKTVPPRSRMLGCNPDFNAWTGQLNPPPPDDPYHIMRTAAGHIHIGWTSGRDVHDSSHFEDCRIVAKQMDYYLGIYSLIWDDDNRRRSMYGKAGAFRPKPYGMEYRTPSNMWLKSSDLMSWVWGAAFRGMQKVFQGYLMEEDFGDLARKIIDENMVDWLYQDQGSKIKVCCGSHLPPVSSSVYERLQGMAKSPVKTMKKRATKKIHLEDFLTPTDPNHTYSILTGEQIVNDFESDF